MQQTLIAWYKSFIYFRKSKGISTEPCGTPHVSVNVVDLKPLMDKYCFLLHT